MIGFFIGETKEDKQKRMENEYCKACRAAKKDVDCGQCSKKVEVKDNGG